MSPVDPLGHEVDGSHSIRKLSWPTGGFTGADQLIIGLTAAALPALLPATFYGVLRVRISSTYNATHPSMDQDRYPWSSVGSGALLSSYLSILRVLYKILCILEPRPT